MCLCPLCCWCLAVVLCCGCCSSKLKFETLRLGMYVELVDGCNVYVLHFKTCGMLVILQSYVVMLIHLNLMDVMYMSMDVMYMYFI